MVKNLLISLMLLSVSFLHGMNNHVVATHCLDKTKYNYAGLVINKYTQVVSAITFNKNNKNSVEDRKTFFTKSMQERSDFGNKLDNILKQTPIFINLQSKNPLGRRVEFKQDLLGKVTYPIVRDQQNSVSTMYPLLRCILATELDGKSDKEVYIATSIDKKNKQTDTFASIEFIKNVSRDGIFLGLSSDKKKKLTYLVDISQNFPNLFDGQIVERGSIVVETNWINKRNSKK
jgi:hypothetical protein